jgi:hypothetical protein
VSSANEAPAPATQEHSLGLIDFADWQGYPRGERAAAWLARLEVNRPEIDAFRAAPIPDAPQYVARPATLAPADGVAAGERSRPIDPQEALSRARASAALNAFTFIPGEVAAGGTGLLAGVPIAVKDLMLVEGMPLSGGGKAMGRPVARRDAQVIARMKRAGAIVVGLTNLHEFAYGITSDNAHFGRVVPLNRRPQSVDERRAVLDEQVDHFAEQLVVALQTAQHFHAVESRLDVDGGLHHRGRQRRRPDRRRQWRVPLELTETRWGRGSGSMTLQSTRCARSSREDRGLHVGAAAVST